MGYSENDYMVRVDFFKPSGKWYCTESVHWLTFRAAEMGIDQAFKQALKKHLALSDGTYRLKEMTAVCLEPYHEHAHPLMMTVSEIAYEVKPHPCPRCGEETTMRVCSKCREGFTTSYLNLETDNRCICNLIESTNPVTLRCPIHDR